MSGDLLAERLVDLVDRPAAVVVVTGGIGCGKSTACRRAARRLRERGIPTGGIIAEGGLESGETSGYDVVDLATGTRRALARTHPPGIPVGRFFMDPAGLEFARACLRQAARTARIAFVDEIGPWELRGGGLAESVRALLAERMILVLVVREELVAAARSTFGIRDVLAWRVPGPSAPKTQDFDRSSGR